MSLTLALRQNGIDYIQITRSNEIRVVCPQCRKWNLNHWEDPKLYINVAANKADCKRCGWHANKKKEIIAFLELKEFSPKELELKEKEYKKSTQITPIPREAIPAYKSKKALKYLYSRNISLSMTREFAFLFCREGYYENRILIPVCDRHGEYRTFISRSILKNVEKKYLNPKGCSISQLLYNLHATKKYRNIVLVEGVFDALHLYPDIPAVATFGKQLSHQQINALRMVGVQEVVLMWDYEAWYNTPEKWDAAVKKLREHFFVRQMKLPEDTPTEYTVNELQAMIRKL